MRPRLSALILCLLALAACAIQRTDLSVVKEGATRAQVENVLGKPIKSIETADGRIDTYEYNMGYQPPPSRSRDPLPDVYGFPYILIVLIPIAAIAHSVRYEEQRAEIDIIYGPDDRVVGRRGDIERREAVKQRKEREAREQADRGDVVAQWRYAHRYTEGWERIDYLCRAARQGHKPSRNYLGYLLAFGKEWGARSSEPPVPVDRVGAYMWWELADRPGWLELQNVSDKMTPDQIAEGERLAAEWTPASPCPSPATAAAMASALRSDVARGGPAESGGGSSRSCTDPAYADLPECRAWLEAWNEAQAQGRPLPSPTATPGMVAPAPTPPVAQSTAAVPTTTDEAGDYAVTLARYHDHDVATAAWSQYVTRFPLLGAAASRVVPAAGADERGTYILQGTGLTEAQATAICDEMRRADAYCEVARS